MSRAKSCILCGSSIAGSVPELEGYRICRTCDVTWCLLDDPPNPADEWEKSYYRRSEIVRLHQTRRSGMEAIVSRLGAVCPERGRLLDVGTGLGILMLAAARDGWIVEGVEPSNTAAEWARKMTGQPVYTGLLEEVNLPPGRYDAVVILDLLRHVSDPLGFLCSARKLLTGGGILLIRETYRSVVRRLTLFRKGPLRIRQRRRAAQPAQCFSPKSLLYALSAVGLERGWVEPSPVFVERASSNLGLAVSRQMLGLASMAFYRTSAGKLLASPNLLAFGRAPGTCASTRIGQVTHQLPAD